VFGGVDTHAATHTAAVVDAHGGVIAVRTFGSDRRGCRALVGWVAGHGRVVRVGVEQTGTYGAGVARELQRRNLAVVEVATTDPAARRADGKDDHLDAVSAARAAVSGRAAPARSRAGTLAALQSLAAARSGAARDARKAMQRLRAELVRAPEPVAVSLRDLTTTRLLLRCANFRRPAKTTPVDADAACRIALRQHARTYRRLEGEIGELAERMLPLVKALDARLLDVNGVGVVIAARILLTLGDNPDRLRSEAALAHLCAAAPIPASSGRTDRHRLNRSGDRAANNALYTIVLCRMRHDPRTKAYVDRRTKQGLSTKEIIRCLKRYIVREVHTALLADFAALTP
jgi:transposase